MTLGRGGIAGRGGAACRSWLAARLVWMLETDNVMIMNIGKKLAWDFKIAVAILLYDDGAYWRCVL